MYGGRITSEEKSAISTYVGVGIAILLIAGGLYFFFLAQKEKKETTTFDPNRPVPSDTVLKQRLKAEEYSVVREGGSQRAFQNQFWNNEKTGIYVDVITGEPLFVSLDKFDAGVGFPTFSKPISKDLLVESLDTSHDMQRTEVHAKRSNAHLGYVFPDPKSPTGQRYFSIKRSPRRKSCKLCSHGSACHAEATWRRRVSRHSVLISGSPACFNC
ncbi:MAG: peptide-methionine (R)-S-oxide reductase [Verrucomicrobia bacterium]|nr:MAG: peptide-methionine (R)-S-oxide reductase [Verrucomicrobiota bacterium]